MNVDVNWFEVLAHHASRRPDRAMTVFEGEATTYGEMAARVAALAGGLHERGVGAGDVVALLSYNCPEFLEAMFAANRLGAVAMPINWRLAAPEVRYILQHSEARALVCDEPLVGLADEACAGLEDSLVRSCIASSAPDGWTTLAELRAGATAPPPARSGPDDVHRLMYTSGTTGRPKGVMITHANLAWKNLAHIVEFGFTADDLALACGPLYHVGALDLTTTSLVAAGATTIIHRVFDAAAVIDELERSRVTTVWLAPAMVNAIMALPDIERRDLSSVRLIINGGEKMPIPLIRADSADVPLGLVRRRLRPDRDRVGRHVPRPRQHRDQARQRRAAVPPPRARGLGRPGPSGLRPVSGARSCCAGPRCSRATGATPTRPRGPSKAGWFHTGDVGVRDDDGYLFIVDRLKDMIVSGGENIAGSEVERVLYEHPAVLEAAVVGRPDERWGEVPVAFVVLRPGGAATRRRAHGALPGPAGPIQGPEGRHLLGGAAAQPVGQGAQARPARPALTHPGAHRGLEEVGVRGENLRMAHSGLGIDTSEAELRRYQMEGQDIPWLLALRAEHRADHPALVWDPPDGATRSWTYRELLGRRPPARRRAAHPRGEGR